MPSINRLIKKAKSILHLDAYFMDSHFCREISEHDVYELIVLFIGSLSEPLRKTSFASDPALAEILDWGRARYTGPHLPEIVQGIYIKPVEDCLLALQYAAKLILALLIHEGGLTAEVAKGIKLDRYAQDWAIQFAQHAPISEETAYLYGKRVQNVAEGGRTSLPPCTISQNPKGTGREGRLFKCIVSLVVRSLDRFINEAKDGKMEGKFRITPNELEPNILQWARAWAEWSPPRDS